MKKIILTTLVVAALAACTSPKADYGKAIQESVLRNAPGDKNAYKFNILELSEQNTITVKDSIQIISEEFAEQKSRDIEYQKTLLGIKESFYKSQQSHRFTPEAEKEQTLAEINDLKRKIDSLAGINTAPQLDLYAGRSADEVLVKVMRCRYEVTDPKTDRKVEETFDFYCSPDGGIVYSKKKVKI